MNFTNNLINWYLHNKRDLPWRNTTDPYPIWLSEIILQQTRVNQGLPYFFNFINAFPTVFDLANASEEQVLKLWQGLGYYSRARNLHATAQYITNHCNGSFPTTFIELKKLKGVGDYTAAAIASFAYNEVVPVVDGNVFRVLSRVFDIESDISKPATKKEFFELSSALIPHDNPALYNQAIMEFGALQCVPQNPNCHSCTLNTICLAFKKNKVTELPVKLKKTKVTKRYFNYAVVIDEYDHILYQQRTAKDIWHNLYEFPLIESSSLIDTEVFLTNLMENKWFDNAIISVEENENRNFVHKLSHQHLYLNFRILRVKGSLKNGISTENFAKLPHPIAINQYFLDLAF